jgi:hypothetical protein
MQQGATHNLKAIPYAPQCCALVIKEGIGWSDTIGRSTIIKSVSGSAGDISKNSKSARSLSDPFRDH